MRLWHYKLIPYLPDKQLIGQWRELNSIFKKQDRHILINYIYNYNKGYLLAYTKEVIDELKKRKYKLNLDNMNAYFDAELISDPTLHYAEHNESYLRQCFYNLQEKHDRKQNDFTDEVYSKLVHGYLSALRQYVIGSVV